jgi:hypothetical protein
MIFSGSRCTFFEIIRKARRNIGSADNCVNGHWREWLQTYRSAKFGFADQSTNVRVSIEFRLLRFCVVLLETAMITAQPLRHPEHGLIGAGIGVRRAALSAEYDLGVKMKGAFGMKA